MVESFFELLARQIRQPSGWFGRGLGHLMAWEHKPLALWALGHLEIRPTDRVLDIGCGGGMAVALAAQAASDGFVAGVDYSDEMVRQASRRNRSSVRSGRVKIEQGDVARLPYDDGSFDKVIAVETFFFWPDPPANLSELHRVMKTGGRVAIVMDTSLESEDGQKHAENASTMNMRLYSGDQLVDLLRGAGFSEAWFEADSEKGKGWLCALALK
jgi:SAM-dependent methyltransferase